MDTLHQTPESTTRPVHNDSTAAPVHSSSSRQRSASARQGSLQLPSAQSTTDAMEDKFASLTAVAGQLFQQRSNNLTQLDALKQETDQSTAIVEQMQKTHSLLANAKAQREADVEELMQAANAKQAQLAQAERAVLRTAMVQERVTRETMAITQRVTDVMVSVVDRGGNEADSLTEKARVLTNGHSISELKAQLATAQNTISDLSILNSEMVSNTRVYRLCSNGCIDNCSEISSQAEIDDHERLMRSMPPLSSEAIKRLRRVCRATATTWYADSDSDEPLLIDEILREMTTAKAAEEESHSADLGLISDADALFQKSVSDPSAVDQCTTAHSALAEATQTTNMELGLQTHVAILLGEGGKRLKAILDTCNITHKETQELLSNDEVAAQIIAEEEEMLSGMEMEMDELLQALRERDESTTALEEAVRLEEATAGTIQEEHQGLHDTDSSLQEQAAQSEEGLGAIVMQEQCTVRLEAEVNATNSAISAMQASFDAITDEITSTINPRLEAAKITLEETKGIYPTLSEFDAELHKCSVAIRQDTLGSIPSVIEQIAASLAEGAPLYGKTTEEVVSGILSTMCPSLPLPPSGCGRWEADEADNAASIAVVPNELRESIDYPPQTSSNPHGGGVAAENHLQQVAYGITNESQFYENGVRLQLMNATHTLDQEANIYANRSVEETASQERHLAAFIGSLPDHQRLGAQRVLTELRQS